MTFMDCVQPPLCVYGIDDSIYTQIMRTLHIILVNFAALDNGRKSDIGTLKKERGDIFSEICTEIFKAKFLRSINEVLFEMVETSLKNKYLGGKTPTSL